ncbi:HEAT repeat domain-containing protein [Streptomyces sp. ASQP_92]|uniref:HEAT repeat domain-containing protein n=1 Tax=Streptomyces sp. ASQP_92 TaxID=2979116 RepID=UPI0021C07498|nr:HEAT repeat domain-containing protein [Streptomyces sp. ASQP_92]MCT9087317.1 HEAT repeat domain-containing protein [Streptomyces sp. ASQP_92]
MAQPGMEGEDPRVELGSLLRREAEAAGLSTREMSDHFERFASQQEVIDVNGKRAEGPPIREMHYSKSHLDRLYRGETLMPSARFVRIFLRITSRAAGISPDRYNKLCLEAEILLRSGSVAARKTSSAPASIGAPGSSGESLATLQLQLSLERARHVGDNLRWALNDAQLLMNTLLQIINVLREIIVDLDIRQISEASTRIGLGTQDSRDEALRYRASAEMELGRVNERRRTLEALWDHARAELMRLSCHPGIVTETSGGASASGNSTVALHQDLLARPALDDIATALAKVSLINDRNERDTEDLVRRLAGGTGGDSEDEFSFLVRAASHPDDDLREAAVTSLCLTYQDDPKVLQIVEERSRADASELVRSAALMALSQVRPMSDRTLEICLERLRYDADAAVRQVALDVAIHSWTDESQTHDALADRVLNDSDGVIREEALQAIYSNWPTDPFTLDLVRTCACDDADWTVRYAALDALREGWTTDSFTRDLLIDRATNDADLNVRRLAIETLVGDWREDLVSRGAIYDRAVNEEVWTVRREALHAALSGRKVERLKENRKRRIFALDRSNSDPGYPDREVARAFVKNNFPRMIRLLPPEGRSDSVRRK